MRGYVGIPLLGASQIWRRVPEGEVEAGERKLEAGERKPEAEKPKADE